MNVRQLANQAGRVTAPLRDTLPNIASGSSPPQRSFAEVLEQAQNTEKPSVFLSSHAQHRIEQRGISWDVSDLQKVAEAITTLESRGARDALLVRPDAAFVVNVPNRTIVTAIGQDELQNRVFTQIDSAMLV